MTAVVHAGDGDTTTAISRPLKAAWHAVRTTDSQGRMVIPQSP
jgi:hypothetical protein